IHGCSPLKSCCSAVLQGRFVRVVVGFEQPNTRPAGQLPVLTSRTTHRDHGRLIRGLAKFQNTEKSSECLPGMVRGLSNSHNARSARARDGLIAAWILVSIVIVSMLLLDGSELLNECEGGVCF